MLWTAVRENGSYAAMVQEALRVRPPSAEQPWRFAVYCDEVTPGNVMAPDNLRRVWIQREVNLMTATAWQHAKLW